MYFLNRRLLGPADPRLAGLLALVPAAVVLVPGTVAAVKFVVERPIF
ncbi:MAG TPA: hypothetical protein VEW03_04590 [Longimicrobiaceae bacterium]|nr:hypothetical protein [Longimicrobiaceae bacterium]